MVTGKQLYVVAVQTVVVDVVECPDAVLLSHHEVIDTVIRGGMYTASARLSGDMITAQHGHVTMVKGVAQLQLLQRDRKSTRLNSSHVASSYAVFCLNKTTKQ